MTHRQTFAVLTVSLGLVTGGCGAATSSPAPPDRVEHLGAHAIRIVLTSAGAQSIGLQTAPARSAGGGVAIPYSALVYDNSGDPYVFTMTRPLTFAPVKVTVQDVAHGVVFVSRGVGAGSRVVSVGAEELLGVQSGVLAQT